MNRTTGREYFSRSLAADSWSAGLNVHGSVAPLAWRVVGCLDPDNFKELDQAGVDVVQTGLQIEPNLGPNHIPYHWCNHLPEVHEQLHKVRLSVGQEERGGEYPARS